MTGLRMANSSVVRRLASPKLAAGLIVTLIVMTLVVVLLPQKGFLGAQFQDFARDVPWLASIMDTLSLDHVFTGWPIIVVSLLLGVNVAACTLLRLQAHRRIPRVAASHDAVTASLPKDSGTDAFLDSAAEVIAGSGFSIANRTEEGFVARAGVSGFWGSMLLHVSLLVIMVGAIATAATSFRGEMVITDGQSVIDSPESYLSITSEPKVGQSFTGARISVDGTKMRYERGVLVSAVAAMRAMDRSGTTISRDVRVNHPLDVAGKSYLLQSSGYAVSMVLGAGDVTPQSLAVRLAERTDQGWRDSMDLGIVDGRPLTLEMLATPVPLAEGERLPAQEFALADPRLEVRLVTPGAAGKAGTVVWQGTLAQGESVPADAGISLTFEDLRLWDRFLVRGEPARWITYLGFWLAVAGSAWRFAVPERRVSVVVEPDGDHAAASVSMRARPWVGQHASADERMVQRIMGLIEAEQRPAEGVGAVRRETKVR